jgi:hypothetical protein
MFSKWIADEHARRHRAQHPGYKYSRRKPEDTTRRHISERRPFARSDINGEPDETIVNIGRWTLGGSRRRGSLTDRFIGSPSARNLQAILDAAQSAILATGVASA